MAFGSLWLQAEALIGDNGVLPATEFLEAVHATFDAGSYWTVPTALWFDYEFTSPTGTANPQGTGQWWTRSDRRLWLPEMARRVPRVTDEPRESP